MNAYEGKKVVFSPGCKHHSSGLHHSHPLIKVKFVFDYQVFFVVLCDGRYPYDVPAEYNIHCITSHTHTYLHHHHFLTGEKSPPPPPLWIRKMSKSIHQHSVGRISRTARYPIRHFTYVEVFGEVATSYVVEFSKCAPSSKTDGAQNRRYLIGCGAFYFLVTPVIWVSTDMYMCTWWLVDGLGRVVSSRVRFQFLLYS